MSGQVDPILSLAVQIFGSSPPNEEGTDAQEGLWPQGKHPDVLSCFSSPLQAIHNALAPLYLKLPSSSLPS